MTRLRAVVGARTAASALSSEEGPSIPRHRVSRPTRDEPPTLWRRGVVGGRAGAHAANNQDRSPVFRRRFSRETRGPQSNLLGAWTSLGPDPNVPAAGATGCCGGPRRMNVTGTFAAARMDCASARGYHRMDCASEWTSRVPVAWSAPARGLPSNLLAAGRRGGASQGPIPSNPKGASPNLAAASAGQRVRTRRPPGRWKVAGGRASGNTPQPRKSSSVPSPVTFLNRVKGPSNVRAMEF